MYSLSHKGFSLIPDQSLLKFHSKTNSGKSPRIPSTPDSPVTTELLRQHPLTQAVLAAHNAATANLITAQEYIRAWIDGVDCDA